MIALPYKESTLVQEGSSDVILPDNILYAVQFCNLCAIRKIPPVLYSLSLDQETSTWFKSIQLLKGESSSSNKRINPSTPVSDSESETSSPDNKISKKDHFLINTMNKLDDTMDKTSKTKEERKPGFNRFESHHKRLILNASAIPTFTTEASNHTEFYTTFLSKKSQSKAKDILIHIFHSDKIAFNLNPTFITNLWKSEFFWILPDFPSGISIFYCLETKSLNTFELEREKFSSSGQSLYF